MGLLPQRCRIIYPDEQFIASRHKFSLDRLTPEKEAEIEDIARELLEFEGDYHYPSGLLANGSHALLGLLSEECRVLRAERDEYARRLPTSSALVH